MNRSQALRRVRAVFRSFTHIYPASAHWLSKLRSGKLYELYCVAEVAERLTVDYGYALRFVGTSIRFKASPGLIQPNDPHFDILDSKGSVLFRLYTDIEFSTLGNSIAGVHDLSAYHELDIAVVDVGAAGRPAFDQIVLGVECKSHAVFIKSLVKEALGLRRELSLLRGPPNRSRLSLQAPSALNVDVAAFPPSEYWLAFVASDGLRYQASPGSFGIAFKHWQP